MSEEEARDLAQQIVLINQNQDLSPYPVVCRHSKDDRHATWRGARGMMVATHVGWLCPFCGYQKPY